MPRFKAPDYGLKMIPVDFAQQVLPGTFEFALCHLVDHELDLSTLRSRYTNDAGGAPGKRPTATVLRARVQRGALISSANSPSSHALPMAASRRTSS
jgi:hypothetical protein